MFRNIFTSASILIVVLISTSCKESTTDNQPPTTIQTLTKQKTPTKVILVRHAEKVISDSKDPDLTDEGVERAKELARVLSKEDIDHIYSSPYNRTRQTVEFLAADKSLEVKEYNPSKLDEVLNLIESNTGQTLIFSGHSNTTPAVLNLLVGEDKFSQLDESDYDNLYIVYYLSKGNAEVTTLEYGINSTP